MQRLGFSCCYNVQRSRFRWGGGGGNDTLFVNYGRLGVATDIYSALPEYAVPLDAEAQAAALPDLKGLRNIGGIPTNAGFVSTSVGDELSDNWYAFVGLGSTTSSANPPGVTTHQGWMVIMSTNVTGSINYMFVR